MIHPDQLERGPKAIVAGPDDSALPTWYRNLLQTVEKMIRTAIEPLLSARTITLWYVLDNGTVALTTDMYIEAPVDFPFVITGVTVLSRTAGAIVLDITRSTFLDYPMFVSIVASAPPQIDPLVPYKAQDNTLIDWTTIIQGGDILSLSVTSNLGLLTRVSVGLRAKPMGQLRR